ncbi:hypothetical protein [Microcoleus sp. D2_18a_B4]|uniref:hypothetical protein n=1 Tax=Microcoleus sp. D2_18a_B4 TaxID=3055329 RepID=UPI002FD2080F
MLNNLVAIFWVGNGIAVSSFGLLSMVGVDRTREGNFTIQSGLFYPLPEIRTRRRAVSLQLIGRWLNLYSQSWTHFDKETGFFTSSSSANEVFS